MKKFTIDPDLQLVCPNIQLSCISCDVSIDGQVGGLWTLIDQKCNSLATSLKTEDIRHNKAIAAAREAYKACGKDPARYRLSSEALLRRVVSGKGLYQINNVVDLLNLVSISTGFSIGGYDESKVVGDIRMGIGQAGELYQGLGRGDLNIEGMPVFRDGNGAFGTSTSDSERTGVSDNTKRFLMVIVSYNGVDGVEEATKMALEYLTNFASSAQFETEIFDFSK